MNYTKEELQKAKDSELRINVLYNADGSLKSGKEQQALAKDYRLFGDLIPVESRRG